MELAYQLHRDEDVSTEEQVVYRQWHPVPPFQDVVLRAVEQVNGNAETEDLPYRFYLLGRKTARAMAWLYARQRENTDGVTEAVQIYEHWRKVPGLVLITCTRYGDEEAFEQACTAAQKFVLSLWSEHVATEWMTAYYQEMDEEHVLQLAHLDPEQERVVGLLGYGYAHDEAPVVEKTNGAVIYHIP